MPKIEIMPESKEDAEKRALRELEGKNIAHYSVLLGAWIQTKMERDKTLVTLSAGAIGLLVTILTAVGVKSVWEIPFFVISITAFLTTIWSSLVIYQLNSQHLEDAIRGSSEKDPRLEKYDKRSIKAFIIGAVSALVIGILSASFQLTKSEEIIVVDKDDSSQKITGKTTLKESVNGVTNLNPNATTKKSLDGITDLNPQATQQPVQPQDQATNNNSNNDQGNSDTSSSNSEKE
jgi:hypothetical protein